MFVVVVVVSMLSLRNHGSRDCTERNEGETKSRRMFKAAVLYPSVWALEKSNVYLVIFSTHRIEEAKISIAHLPK